MMNPVGIRDLKANLSAYVERARAGEEIIVMHRGEPVVKVIALDYEDPRARGIREGWLKPAQTPGGLREHVFPSMIGNPDVDPFVELQHDRDRWAERAEPDRDGSE